MCAARRGLPEVRVELPLDKEERGLRRLDGLDTIARLAENLDDEIIFIHAEKGPAEGLHEPNRIAEMAL